jgi:hypothetical protein
LEAYTKRIHLLELAAAAGPSEVENILRYLRPTIVPRQAYRYRARICPAALQAELLSLTFTS